jgi:hypothetical protein
MLVRPRLPVLLVLVSVLFLRALVPAGWMPVAGAGAFAIAPCPAADAAPMVMAAGFAFKQHHGTGRDQHASDCAFAPFHSAFAAAPGPSALPASFAAPDILLSFSGSSALATGPPALPPPSTGPPHFT